MYYVLMEEGRKRVLGIIAGILVARHLKSPEDLYDSRPSARAEWNGIGPDNSPLLVRDISTQEIYALDTRWP